MPKIKHTPAPGLSATSQLIDFNDEPQIMLTPQEWHQQHVEFMTTNSDLYSDASEAEELESVTYFDQHCRIVLCCIGCLEMIGTFGRRLTATHTCPNCGLTQTGQQACRAAYLALLGITHSNCTLTNQEFIEKTNNLNPFEFVQKYIDKCEQNLKQSLIAERKALKLLKNLFGIRVYNQIVNNGETWVHGADGYYYRLFWSRHGNVAVYEHRYKSQAEKAGKPWEPMAAYCGHFGENYPISDQIIAQICMIQNDPARYISQANLVKPENMKYCGPELMHKLMMGQIVQISI